MQLSKKVLVTILALAVILTFVAALAIFYKPANDWFRINTGGWGAGLLNLAQTPLRFALAGGAQTALFWGLGFAALFGFAYWVWHWDIGYKLTGATAPATPATNYDRTMAREPPVEPERGK